MDATIWDGGRSVAWPASNEPARKRARKSTRDALERSALIAAAAAAAEPQAEAEAAAFALVSAPSLAK